MIYQHNVRCEVQMGVTCNSYQVPSWLVGHFSCVFVITKAYSHYFKDCLKHLLLTCIVHKHITEGNIFNMSLVTSP